MIEALRHLFGLCGEPHGSVLTMLGITPIFYMLKDKIKKFCKFIYLSVKILLQRK